MMASPPALFAIMTISTMSLSRPPQPVTGPSSKYQSLSHQNQQASLNMSSTFSTLPLTKTQRSSSSKLISPLTHSSALHDVTHSQPLNFITALSGTIVHDNISAILTSAGPLHTYENFPTRSTGSTDSKPTSHLASTLTTFSNIFTPPLNNTVVAQSYTH